MLRQLSLRLACLVAVIVGLAACSGLPRGAALNATVTSGAEADTADFVVYPVTRAFLPQVETWPVTGERAYRWLPHSHGSRERVIRPGDHVSLAVWDASENSLIAGPGTRVTPLTDLRVSPAGSIFVPYVGNVQVAGATPEAARSRVERALDGFVPSAQVQLAMVEGPSNTVRLVGGAAMPGLYPMPDNSFSVLDLISTGGGVRAGLRNPEVKLHRGQEFFVTSLATLYDDPRQDAVLRGGDQVIIEEDKRYFLSLGASGRETVHPFTKAFISATDAMAIAGGVLDSRGDPGGILVLREYPPAALAAGTRGPQKQRVVFSLDLTSADGLFSARKFRINSEDLIYITEAPVTRAAAVVALVGSGFGLVNLADAAAN